MKGISNGLVLAAAAAALLASGVVTTASAAEHHHGVKCSGVNACQGKSECKMPPDHACKGKNACKGKGWEMRATAEECQKEGGTVMEEKKK